jgi:hypothetical protein
MELVHTHKVYQVSARTHTHARTQVKSQYVTSPKLLNGFILCVTEWIYMNFNIKFMWLF